MNYAWTKAEFPHLSWKSDFPLAPITYFRIGGPADVFVVITESNDLEKVVSACIAHQAPWTILGGGSNVLVSDKGIRGVVIQNKTQGISYKLVNEDKTEVEVASGVAVNLVVRDTVDHELAGMDAFLGLPGTIGGAVVNNSHYTQRLIGEFVHEVDVISPTGERKTYTQQEMHFRYDYSILQDTKDLVVRVRLRLSKGKKEELERTLLESVKKRTGSQPIGEPSSGCMFQNIVLLNGEKESAGKLIDRAGCKGMRVGDAEVSSVHANFIVNKGKATANDVLQLAEEVQEAVQEKFGLTLHREVFLLGEW